VYSGVLSFSASDAGVLAYGTGTARSGLLQLVWVDRQGKTISTVGPAGNYVGLDLSPDGKRVAVHRHEGSGDGSGGDIWILDLARDTASRFTFDASLENASPVWSPDGTRIAYGSNPNHKEGVYVKPADGTSREELLFESDRRAGALLPKSWAPDGRAVVYATPAPDRKLDLWVLPTSGERKPAVFAGTPFNENFGQVSPDGRWIAYQSDESGVQQVYSVRSRRAAGSGKCRRVRGSIRDGGAMARSCFILMPD
jgi:Tol biopolymer transport system component